MAGVEVWKRSGEVANVQNMVSLESSTTSSGGGGYLYQGSGYVHAPTVSTKVSSVTTQRVFVTDQHGDWVFDVDEGFAVRPGNHVQARFVKSRRGGGRMYDVDNLNTGRGWVWPLEPHLPQVRYIWVLWFVYLCICAFISRDELYNAERWYLMTNITGYWDYLISSPRMRIVVLSQFFPASFLFFTYRRRAAIRSEIQAALAKLA